MALKASLLNRVLNDLGRTEISPPQLQLVCTALYETLPASETIITMESYERAHGAAGILRDHLAHVLSRELQPGQRKAARQLLESLITSAQERVIRTHSEVVEELTRQGITPQVLDAILSQLVDSRLVKVEETESGMAYELAHDYLLDEIKLDPAVRRARPHRNYWIRKCVPTRSITCC